VSKLQCTPCGEQAFPERSEVARLVLVAKADPAMARSLLTMTLTTFSMSRTTFPLLGRKTSLERVAAFLLEMSGRLTAAGVRALPMNRRDTADYLGLGSRR
jgi:CRP/FNR family nitrogen fixation transcriptional regulator